MKVLMVGLGSIGQRHMRNLRRLYGEGLELLAYRVRRSQLTFDDKLRVRDGVGLEEEFHIMTFTDLDEALREEPDVAFITNITSEHVACARKAARAGCDIFLEKPVSNTMDGVRELSQIVKERQLILYMGYQNRFHPCIREARQILAEGRVGRLISADSEYGERLPSMHAYEDYRGTYMAQEGMGGGPVLNLQIHCLDYLQWLLGEPVSVCSMMGRRSGLDIDVEDHALSLYTFRQSGGEIVPVYAHTDFLQYPPVHRLKLVGEHGRIELDLNRAETAVFSDSGQPELLTHPDFERNDMFLQELREFMECLERRSEPGPDLDQGITGLKMALAAKKSATEGRTVLLEELA